MNTTTPHSLDAAFPLDDVITAAVRSGASDLHLAGGMPPGVRLSGALTALPGFPTPTETALRTALDAMLTPNQRAEFNENLELDCSYQAKDGTMLRCNLYWARGSISAAFRVLADRIPTFAELRLPESLKGLVSLKRGLVLVVGPTGSGKSTTLASMLDLANRTRSDHIITIEDPIEYVHTSNRCVVSQREVGVDTKSFAEALRRALRQDPDIILVGEMRDRETIEIALRAAETGHLVFATLHTQDVAQTIDRIVDVFEGDQQEQVRSQLSTTLQAVVAQVLCRTIDGHSRVPATEVMVATPAIRSLLREGKTAQIYSTIHTGGQAGMHTLDQSLAELVKAGEITYETGAEFSRHLDEFGRLCGRSLSAAATARTTLTDPYAAYQGI